MSDEDGAPADAGAASPSGGAERNAAQFKTKVIAAEHTEQEINLLWKQLQFETTPVDLTQFTRQHNILIENALTALAKNVKNLKEASAKCREDIMTNSKAIGRMGGKDILDQVAAEDDDDTKMADLLKQFAEFKESTNQKMEQLTSEVAEQKAENEKLQAEVVRLAPMAEKVEQMGAQLVNVGEQAQQAASDPDFSPVWEATDQLVVRLGRLETESENHARQLDHALSVLAADEAADDVLQTLDADVLAQLDTGHGHIDEDELEDSEAYKNMLKQSEALGLKALDKQFAGGMLNNLFGGGDQEVVSAPPFALLLAVPNPATALLRSRAPPINWGSMNLWYVCPLVFPLRWAGSHSSAVHTDRRRCVSPLGNAGQPLASTRRQPLAHPGACCVRLPHTRWRLAPPACRPLRPAARGRDAQPRCAEGARTCTGHLAGGTGRGRGRRPGGDDCVDQEG